MINKAEFFSWIILRWARKAALRCLGCDGQGNIVGLQEGLRVVHRQTFYRTQFRVILAEDRQAHLLGEI